MAVLGYLPKLKGGLGLAFGAHFLHDFSIKMCFIQYYINRQSFNVIPLFLPKISHKMYYKFLFSQLMMSQTIRLMLDQPPKQWLTWRKRGEYGNKRI